MPEEMERKDPQNLEVCTLACTRTLGDLPWKLHSVLNPSPCGLMADLHYIEQQLGRALLTVAQTMLSNGR